MPFTVRALLAMACCLPAAETQPSVATSAQLDMHVAEAQRAMADGHFDIAQDLWLRAAIVAPGDQRVLTGMAALRRIRIGAGNDHGDERSAREAERVAIEAKRLLATARERAQAQPELARDHVVDAISLLRTRDPRGEALAIAQEAAALLAELQPVVLARHQADQAQQVHGQLDRARQAATEAVRADGTRRTALIERIKALIAREHFELALQHIRTAQRLLPEDAEIQSLWLEALERAHDRRRLSLKERELEVRNEMMRRIEQDLMPTASDGFVAYAQDWNERSRRRLQTMSTPLGTPAMPAWEESLRDRLAQKIPLDVQEASAVSLLRSLSSAHGLNIIIDNALASSGDKPVSLTVNNMRIEHVLDWIVSQVGCTWMVTEGGIFVGTAVKEPVTLTVHDASALAVQYRDFPPFRIGLPNAGAGQAGAAAPSLFGNQGAGTGATGNAQGTGLLNPKEFEDLLRRVVVPDYWKANPDAGLTFSGNLLLVSAAPSVQRLVAEFIRHQAQLASLMVHCHVRWVTLTDTDIQRIGINWHAPVTEFLATETANGLYRTTQNSITSGTLTSPLPPMRDPALTQVSGSTNSGLKLQYAHLGPVQLSAVFEALELSQQGQALDGIELSTLNGLQSTTSFVRQVPYIAGYTTSGGQFDPTISIINVGNSLTLRPRVSADRKYVIVDLEPAVATVEFYTAVISAVQSIPVGNGAVVFTADFPIELPLVRLNAAGTAVQVPDRGTLLVGGMTNTIEQRGETRLPLLADIPYLGRLFSTRGRLSARSRLYLLATFTILDMPEQESLQ